MARGFFQPKEREDIGRGGAEGEMPARAAEPPNARKQTRTLRCERVFALLGPPKKSLQNPGIYGIVDTRIKAAKLVFRLGGFAARFRRVFRILP